MAYATQECVHSKRCLTSGEKERRVAQRAQRAATPQAARSSGVRGQRFAARVREGGTGKKCGEEKNVAVEVDLVAEPALPVSSMVVACA